MPDRLTQPARAHTLIGGCAFILATLQFLLAQVVAAAAWNPPYSWTNNFISDLGNTACGPFALPHGISHYVCSPDHALMNGSFAVTGLLTLAGTMFLWRGWATRRMATLALTLLLVAGALKILVGFAPENTNGLLHFLGATNLPLQSIAILLLSITIAARQRNLAFLGMVMAMVGLAGAVLSIAAQSAGPALLLGLGSGGMERVAGYPGNLWMLVAGIVAISTSRRDLQRTEPDLLRDLAHSPR